MGSRVGRRRPALAWLLVSWLIPVTLATAGSPPSTVSPTALLAQVPDDARWALAVVAPQAASHAASAFFAGCSQRLLPEQLAAQSARFRRRFGLAPDSLEDFVAAGLDPTAGCVLFASGPGAEPLLLARVADGARFAAFERGFVGFLPADAERGVSPFQGVPMLRGPYASVAHVGDLAWLEAGGAGVSLAAAVSRHREGHTLGMRSNWMPPPLAGEGTVLHLYWPAPAAEPAAAGGQSITVAAGALGLDVRGVALAAPAATTAGAAPEAPAAIPWASAGDGAWLRVGGQSLATWAAALPRQPLPIPASVAPPVRAALEDGQRRAAQAARALAVAPGLDGPFVARIEGPTDAPQWTASWTAGREGAAAAFVRRLAGKQAAPRRLRVDGRGGCEAVRATARPALFVGRCGRSLAAAGQERALGPLLAQAGRAMALAPTPPPARPGPAKRPDASQPSAPVARLSFDPALLAGHLRRALVARTPQGPLGEWLPMPQLMLAGPLGDALADLEALGHVDGVSWRQDARLLWHLQQRRLPGPPP